MPEPTDVLDDAHATADQLHQRADDDYARAEAARAQDSHRA